MCAWVDQYTNYLIILPCELSPYYDYLQYRNTILTIQLMPSTPFSVLVLVLLLAECLLQGVLFRQVGSELLYVHNGGGGYRTRSICHITLIAFHMCSTEPTFFCISSVAHSFNLSSLFVCALFYFAPSTLRSLWLFLHLLQILLLSKL